MKLNRDFLTYDTGEKSLLVPTGKASFSGLVQGNRVLGIILSLLESETTEAEILEKMKARYDAPEDQLRKDIGKALDALRGIGALDE